MPCRTLLCASLLTILPQLLSAADVFLPADPDVSPNGKTIAFSWRGDIWLAPTSGGAAKRLTSHPGRDSQPRFSPDGRRIAFVSDRGLGSQIYTIAVQGGEPEVRTVHTRGYSLEGWYPDGEHLLTSGRRDHFWKQQERFFRIRADRVSAEQLLFDDYGDEASLSPDGLQILFVREGMTWWRKGYVGSRDGQIWLYDIPTQKFKKLLDQPGGFHWPMWKPDGKGFYCVAAPRGVANLFEVDLESLQLQPITKYQDDGVAFPALSRDGKTLVFRRLFDLYRLDPQAKKAPQLIRLTAQSDEPLENLKRTTLTKATQATFTHDGLEIAFIAGGDVWVMDTELREPRQVTATPEEERDPVFAPDGESLIFVSDRGGQTDLYRVKRGDPKLFWWQNEKFTDERLTEDSAVEANPKFRPDGGKLAYIRGNGDLWTMNADGTDAKRIVESWSRPDFNWSPDGKWFVYAVFDEDFNRDVWLRPSDGTGTPYNVSRHPDNDGTPVWSPDGKLLAFTGRRAGQEIDVHYVWLRKQDDETSSRDRLLETAREKIEKARKKPSSPPSSGSSGTTTKTTGTETTSKPKTPTNITIDFDGLHERLRTISLPHAEETELVWSPDSKRLAFVATIRGDRGLYAVGFPNPGTPTKLIDDTGNAPRWLNDGNQIVWLSKGLPASVSITSSKQTTYRFSTKHTFDLGAKYIAGFDQCWRIMRDHWYDERLGNRNWDEVRRKYRDAAGRAADDEQFTTVVSMMLGELNGSHLGFMPRSAAPTTEEAPVDWKPTTAHLGVRFDSNFKGPGLKIRDVLPRGPADHDQARLRPGEIIVSLDGTPVDPQVDLASLLTGPFPRDVRLVVKGTDGKERQVSLRPIAYRDTTRLLYEQWVRTTRRRVEEASQGTLGYLHISSMDEPSLLRFEEELYSAASGKTGLVIDVRENGGGSTTDHLLTMLTQPTHAITIPRGGRPGYPQDRKIYATWNKPIVVLCNQNSFSNAEVFSHAIKTLKRGSLVGVPTAGGVVSTGAVSVMDLGTLRLPFRGWYITESGEDMELNGAKPDYLVWPEPGEMPAGRDAQLEKALEVLAAEVKAWEARPRPILKKATER